MLRALQNCSGNHQLGLIKSWDEPFTPKCTTIIKMWHFPPTKHDRKSVLTCISDDPNQCCPSLLPPNNRAGQACFSRKISTGRLCYSWRWGFQQGCEEQDAPLGTEIQPNSWSFVEQPQGAFKVFQWQDTLAEMAEILPLPWPNHFLQLHQQEGVLRQFNAMLIKSGLEQKSSLF